MSYQKAMQHARNVRKLKKQSRMYMGFDAGTGHWPNPRRNPATAAWIEIFDWFKHRHLGGAPNHARECIRERIREYRSLISATGE